MSAGRTAADADAPLFRWLAYSLRVLEPMLSKVGLSLPSPYGASSRVP
ncbi:hypothetical protein [Streptomyces sp. B21-083]